MDSNGGYGLGNCILYILWKDLHSGLIGCVILIEFRKEGIYLVVLEYKVLHNSLWLYVPCM